MLLYSSHSLILGSRRTLSIQFYRTIKRVAVKALKTTALTTVNSKVPPLNHPRKKRCENLLSAATKEKQYFPLLGESKENVPRG